MEMVDQYSPKQRGLIHSFFFAQFQLGNFNLFNCEKTSSHQFDYGFRHVWLGQNLRRKCHLSYISVLAVPNTYIFFNLCADMCVKVK